MTFHGAVIKEQGTTFAIVIVQQHVVQNRAEADRVIRTFGSQAFPGIPVVLMAQDSQGFSTYYGRTDIARFMASVPISAVPWQEYTIS